MPTYAALLHYTQDYDWTAPELAGVMAEYGEFHDAAADVNRGGAALRPTTTATTVHVRGGKGGDLVVNDGPYAEAKEVLGGSTCWRPPTSMRQSAGRSRSRPVVPMSG